MTLQEQESLGGSCRALIDFSLVNSDLVSSTPRRREAAKEGVAENLVLCPHQRANYLSSLAGDEEGKGDLDSVKEPLVRLRYETCCKAF